MPLITAALCLRETGKQFDTKLPGFYVNITSAGASFAWKGRPTKGADQRTLPVVKLARAEITDAAIDAARGQATQLIADLRNGKKTAVEVRTESDNAALTFEQVARKWLAVQARTRHAGVVGNVLSNLSRPFRAFGFKKFIEVTDTDIQKLLDGIVAEGHSVLSNNVRSALSSIWKWAKQPGQKFTKDDPTTRLGERAVVKANDRFLRREEVRKLWHDLGGRWLPVDRRTVLVIKLVLATGLRPGEVLLARRSDIACWGDEDGGDGKLAYRNPGTEAGRSKKARQIIQPLNSVAQEVVAELLALPTQDDRLVPPGRDGGLLTTNNFGRDVRELCKFLGWDKPEAKTVKGGVPFSPFTPHELRHTAATQLGLGWTERGIRRTAKADTARILDHKGKGTVTDVYDISESILETELRRETLDHWDTLLRAIIKPVAGEKTATNVIKLGRAA